MVKMEMDYHMDNLKNTSLMFSNLAEFPKILQTFNQDWTP